MINVSIYDNSTLMMPLELSNKECIVNSSIVEEHPIHMHNCIEIVYVLEGAIELSVSFKKLVLGKGEFSIINSYDLHQIKKIEENTKIAYIYVGDELSSELNLMACEPELLKGSKELYNSICRSILHIINIVCVEKKDASETRSEIRNIINMLNLNYRMSKSHLEGEEIVVTSKDTVIDRMEEIISYLYFHYDEHITLESLAETFSLSKYYLSHFIRKYCGFSFKELVNVIRIDRAQVLILDNQRPISEICFALGFSSINYFNKQFEQYFGTTPAKYRAQMVKDTIISRGFDEVPYKITKKDLASGTSENEGFSLEIFLGNEKCDVTVIKSSEDASETEKMYIESDMEVDFDTEEMIIILKRKK